VASQTGAVPLQLALERQVTQRFGDAVVRHSGVDPLQSLLATHWSTKTSVVWTPEVAELPSDG
jgi:hypothetical protein